MIRDSVSDKIIYFGKNWNERKIKKTNCIVTGILQIFIFGKFFELCN